VEDVAGGKYASFDEARRRNGIRGCRYRPHLYVEKLKARGLSVSRHEEPRCYENARAERLNGILKQEYSLGCSFRSKKQALAAVSEAVFLYNTRRPHLSLKMKRLKIRAVGSHKNLSTCFRT
jgi:transposase InsO family protein